MSLSQMMRVPTGADAHSAPLSVPHDWSPPRAPAKTPTAKPASVKAHGETIRGYSRLVVTLKIALPLLALGLVGMLAAWPALRDVRAPTAKLDRGQIEMVGARYFSRDKENRPFSVNSQTAVQSPESNDLVDMVKPVAEITQVDGTWVTMRSDRGRYNQADGRLLMFDNVHVLRDDGFEFFTSLAQIDTKAGLAWGDEHVDGQGPSGEIDAIGFRIYDHGRTVTFLHAPTAVVSAGEQKAKPKPPGTSK